MGGFLCPNGVCVRKRVTSSHGFPTPSYVLDLFALISSNVAYIRRPGFIKTMTILTNERFIARISVEILAWKIITG